MELKTPSAAELRYAYTRDMETSFPPMELKPLSSIENSIRQKRYLPWCLYDGEEIAGECFLWLGNPGFALLDYLCVEQSRRNDGLGSLMLAKMRERLPESVILCEAEAAEYADDPVIAKRRLGFYTRNHAYQAEFQADVFGVRYAMLYWAAQTMPETLLMREYENMYFNMLPPGRFRRYFRLIPNPQEETAAGEKTAWGG